MNIESATRMIETLGLFVSGFIILATAASIVCREPRRRALLPPAVRLDRGPRRSSRAFALALLRIPPCPVFSGPRLPQFQGMLNEYDPSPGNVDFSALFFLRGTWLGCRARSDYADGMNIDFTARTIGTLGLFVGGLINLVTAACIVCREPHWRTRL